VQVNFQESNKNCFGLREMGAYSSNPIEKKKSNYLASKLNLFLQKNLSLSPKKKRSSQKIK